MRILGTLRLTRLLLRLDMPVLGRLHAHTRSRKRTQGWQSTRISKGPGLAHLVEPPALWEQLPCCQGREGHPCLIPLRMSQNYMMPPGGREWAWSCLFFLTSHPVPMVSRWREDQRTTTDSLLNDLEKTLEIINSKKKCKLRQLWDWNFQLVFFFFTELCKFLL